MTTENNVAAQAGDEPMAYMVGNESHVTGIYRTMYDAQVALSWSPDYKLTPLYGSPRATADVERDAARYRWLRERPYSDWKRIAFNTMDDHPFAIRCRDEEIDAAIATTKPGA